MPTPAEAFTDQAVNQGIKSDRSSSQASTGAGRGAGPSAGPGRGSGGGKGRKLPFGFPGTALRAYRGGLIPAQHQLLKSPFALLASVFEDRHGGSSPAALVIRIIVLARPGRPSLRSGVTG